MNNLANMLMENSNVTGYHMFQTVLEYYQGKTKELRKCEGYCDNIVNKLTNISDYDLTKTPISRDDEDARALEKELSNFFKVDNVRIYWQSSNSPNAMTITNSCFTRAKANKNILVGDHTNMNINIFVYTPMITVTGVTGSELLAIILHEIGHNFTFCEVSAAFDIYGYITSMGLIAIEKYIAKGIFIGVSELYDLIRKNVPLLSNMIDVYNRFKLEFLYLLRPINVINPISIAFSLIRNVLIHGIHGLILKYGEEKSSDSFAAKYGYGNDLALALKKMNIPKYSLYGNIAHSTGIGEIIADIVALESVLVSSLSLEVHPNDDQRTASMIKKLKSDLANGDYPKEVEKELKAEISRLENTHKNINKINESSNGVHIRQAIFDVINNVTDNKSDIRELFNFYFDSYRF